MPGASRSQALCHTFGRPPSNADWSRMMTRRDEIDQEIRQLKKLADQLTDEKTLEGIASLIADLEAEKAALADEK